jgi:hypothetical protein
MPRKNSTMRNRQAPRRERGVPAPRRVPHMAPVPIEKIVVPKGRCFFRSRHGKLRFSADEVAKALKQAQHNRKLKGSTHSEARYYECPPGGCGDYHLTSRESYTDPRA